MSERCGCFDGHNTTCALCESTTAPPPRAALYDVVFAARAWLEVSRSGASRARVVAAETDLARAIDALGDTHVRK